MSFYDQVWREAMHDYDPEPDWDQPTKAELALDCEMTEGDLNRAMRCPYCGENVMGAWAETRHMSTKHPDVVKERLRKAGFSEAQIDDFF